MFNVSIQVQNFSSRFTIVQVRILGFESKVVLNIIIKFSRFELTLSSTNISGKFTYWRSHHQMNQWKSKTHINVIVKRLIVPDINLYKNLQCRTIHRRIHIRLSSRFVSPTSLFMSTLFINSLDYKRIRLQVLVILVDFYYVKITYELN